MQPLALIWITALVLVAGAVIWLGLLIVLRINKDRAQAARARDRIAVTAAFLRILQDPEASGAALQPYLGRARLLAEALLDIQRLIRGADDERLLGVLRSAGVIHVLAARLHRGSRAGRLVSLEALAALAAPEAQVALRRALLEATDNDFRLATLKALTDAGAPAPIDRLIEYQAAGQIPASRLFGDLLRHAAMANPQAAVAALHRLDLGTVARPLLVDALGWTGDYQVLPSLIKATTSLDAEVRTAASRALGRLQHPLAEPALAQALQDQIWTVRSAAAEAVGQAGLQNLAPALQALLSDEEWWVRFRAGDALLRLGEAGREHLRTAAQEEGPVARQAAALAMAERGVS